MERLTQISDFLTNNWATIMGVLTGTGLGWYLVRLLFRLVVVRIESKTKGKFSKPILDAIAKQEVKNREFEQRICEKIETHNLEIDNKLKVAFEEEEAKKRKAYEDIMSESVPETIIEETTEVVEEVIEETEGVNEPPVEEEKKPSEFKRAKRVIEDE
jgi:hypothetical protein